MTADEDLMLPDDAGLPLDFCVSYVRGVEPDEVLRRLGGEEPVDLHSVGHFQLAGDDLPDGFAVVSAFAAGAWTVLFEANNFLATYDEVIQVLSAGGELVSFYHNEDTSPQFNWAVDGRKIVVLDPTWPEDRHGTDPRRLDATLTRLGFDLTHSVTDPGFEHDDLFQKRTFALMEHLTGVRLTEDLLQETVFRCAAVPEPPTARPSPEVSAAARRALRYYAEDPDRDTMAERDWDGLGIADRRLRDTGHLGLMMHTNANAAFQILAACDDDQLRAVARWGRQRIVEEAERDAPALPGPLRDALLHGAPLSPADREHAEQQLAPDPGFPPFARGGRLLLGARQRTAMRLLGEPERADPLTTALHVANVLAQALGGRYDEMSDDLRRMLHGT
ncbi:DUF6461 domain-containing protein [Dactylosporangium siamense]|uniref:DUF6461 domain-containing protein n=1 Tax=Dactylosporangium siamense TaxID=685454 RepID=UPI001941F70C|nr:DUF6461 domain-containing protein [Dactylosporangium siamense]